MCLKCVSEAQLKDRVWWFVGQRVGCVDATVGGEIISFYITVKKKIACRYQWKIEKKEDFIYCISLYNKRLQVLRRIL